MADDQSEAIRFLMTPATYGGKRPEHVETHGAHVFLAGDTALKIKRAVRYDYMDLSTLDLRERMLRRELELNRPVAPGIYRDVVPITRGPGGLAIDGDGPPVEWVLRMHRFPKEDELIEVAARGDLDPALADELGGAVADFHMAAPLREADGAELIRAILDELDDAFVGMRQELGADRRSAFHDATRAALEHIAPLLRQRSAAGHVRRCHGDLHLRNLVLIGGRPVPFDALEFDEVLGTCDVLYDLAFLLMDLDRLGHGLAANVTLNAWLLAFGGREDAGLAALPLFLSVRAAIRAMVTVQTDHAAGRPGANDAEARDFLDEAMKALSPKPPLLVAVGGLSGTGKTLVSRRLAPGIGAMPGAVHLRSDLERKRLAGVGPLDHLPPDAYSGASGREVYAEMMQRAQTLLAAGQSVLADATWLLPAERAALQQVARRARVPFKGLWLDAPVQVLLERVSKRTADASDADAAVVRLQHGRDPGRIGWTRVDASGSPETTLNRALAVLQC